MKSIDILHPGILSSLQDLGRVGYAFYAVPRSGIMDHVAYDRISSILQLPKNHTVIECTLKAPKIRFSDAMVIAISGADMQWKLNENPIERDTQIIVKKGDVLAGNYAKTGFRGYIGFSSEMKVKKHFGSSSSYSYASLGAKEGQALKKGDKLFFEDSTRNIETEISYTPIVYSNKITLQKGPEYHLLSSEAIDKIRQGTFRVSPQSNRMGARLTGPKIEGFQALKNSVAVLPGFVQLLPSGQLIVILQDGQTTGGYPRFAYLTQKELSKFNQIAIGKKVRFELG